MPHYISKNTVDFLICKSLLATFAKSPLSATSYFPFISCAPFLVVASTRPLLRNFAKSCCTKRILQRGVLLPTWTKGSTSKGLTRLRHLPRDGAVGKSIQGMSDRRSFDRRSQSRSFFRDRDRDRRSPFGPKIAGRSRSWNSMIAIAKTRSRSF